MRAVIDTNVVFEGLTKQGGVCGLIIDAWRAGSDIKHTGFGAGAKSIGFESYDASGICRGDDGSELIEGRSRAEVIEMSSITFDVT